jgi:hypothetical protein
MDQVSDTGKININPIKKANFSMHGCNPKKSFRLRRASSMPQKEKNLGWPGPSTPSSLPGSPPALLGRISHRQPKLFAVPFSCNFP